MSIGKNIQYLREAHGLTQSQMGEIAGVTDKAVSTWENETKVPRMGAIERIASHFMIKKSVLIDEDLGKGQTIGERIKERREQLQMSQDELAKRLGYKSRSSINKIEIGCQNLTQPKIKALADALDTTPSYIMGWEESASSADNGVDDRLALFMSLSPEAQEKALEYMELLKIKESAK